jgi:structural maintenance of chromosome 3 (chondroitin sulfate proteoglycan 6)
LNFFSISSLQRTLAISKRESNARKIQELGSLPPPAELQKYAQLSISQLVKELEKINKQLKKYSHVNKKAYDQYVNFSEQRESLLHRKEQLDSDDTKIKELIESLDRKKDEAINRTFRGVSSHFKDVFKELVPNGSGELIMRTALDEGGSQTDEENSSDDSTLSPKKKKAKTATAESQETAASTGPNIYLYRGVGIKVRFSEIGENFMMSQLSGGQKALVALALIFAIQRCDPAPFYLFDELDQALDQTYRSAVANLIQKQANSEENPTQFIVSTFRPELVRVANQCYGISHQNKVSSVHPFQKREALKFISNLMNEEEALGEVRKTGGAGAAAASSKRKSVSQGKRQQQQGKDDDASASQEGGTTAATSVAEASTASQANKQKALLSPATEDSGKDDDEDVSSEASTP